MAVGEPAQGMNRNTAESLPLVTLSSRVRPKCMVAQRDSMGGSGLGRSEVWAVQSEEGSATQAKENPVPNRGRGLREAPGGEDTEGVSSARKGLGQSCTWQQKQGQGQWSRS